MPGFGFNADENRIWAIMASLEFGGKLKGVCRNHAVVMIGGGDEGGRIVNAIFQVVQGRVSQQVSELSGVFA